MQIFHKGYVIIFLDADLMKEKSQLPNGAVLMSNALFFCLYFKKESRYCILANLQ